MKYLKTYKLFESSKSVDMDIIKDIFIDLEDDGFLIETYPSDVFNDDRIRVVITKPDSRYRTLVGFEKSHHQYIGFDTNDVKDCVGRFISYSKQCSRFINISYTYRCHYSHILGNKDVEFKNEFPSAGDIEMFMIDIVFKTWWKKLIQNPY